MVGKGRLNTIFIGRGILLIVCLYAGIYTNNNNASRYRINTGTAILQSSKNSIDTVVCSLNSTAASNYKAPYERY